MSSEDATPEDELYDNKKTMSPSLDAVSSCIAKSSSVPPSNYMESRDNHQYWDPSKSTSTPLITPLPTTPIAVTTAAVVSSVAVPSPVRQQVVPTSVMDKSDKVALKSSAMTGTSAAVTMATAASAGTSDSESWSVPGNLNDFVACPPGFDGQRKAKGHLIFNASFESGNLAHAVMVSPFEVDLSIRPDTCCPKYRVWFYFTVRNVKAGQRVIFNLINYSKSKSLFRIGMSPMVASTSRPRWERLPPKNVYYYKSPRHRKSYVLSFLFAFDEEDDVYCFAYCFPYTYSRLKRYLGELESLNMSHVHREVLGFSVQQRPLDMLTITSPRNMDPNIKKKVVFVTARVHPGETPASFVCQGLIDFLCSSHPCAVALRDHVVFKIVPMLNPDGVYLGNYRCSFMGYDLNRHWQEPSVWAHPTLVLTKNTLLQLECDPNVDLEFFVDIHAHSTMLNGFMYGNTFTDVERLERQAVFPRLLCNNAHDFSLESTSFNRDKIKEGTGRRTLAEFLSASCNCYTLEVSFFSFTTSQTADGHTDKVSPYLETDYMKLGKNFGRTFADYFGVTPQETQQPLHFPPAAACTNNVAASLCRKNKKNGGPQR